MSDEELVDEHGTMRFFTPSSEKSQPITFNTLQETGAGKDFDPSEDSWTLRGKNFELTKRTEKWCDSKEWTRMLVGVTDMDATVQFPDDATDIPEPGSTVRLEHYAVGLDGRIAELPDFRVISGHQCGSYVAFTLRGDGAPKPLRIRDPDEESGFDPSTAQVPKCGCNLTPQTSEDDTSDSATCPDCNGTGEYRGLIKVETCETCGGKGKA